MNRVAPLPGCDASDYPISFVAVTVANMLEPSLRVHGDAVRIWNGIVQVRVCIFSSNLPSQYSVFSLYES